ncbi:MAG: CPBP family intramembrane metalloprotease [Candidatus Omnitrophica bacterium]|nr:CPBP family intramembrane metalloprotease [Candidatus Omnitrophota bacterium]
MMRITLPKIRNFIIKERMYVWLLIFIISVSITLALTKDAEKLSPLEDKVGQLEQASSRVEELSAKLLKKPMTKEELTKFIQENKKAASILSVLSFIILFVIAAGLFLDFIIFILKREGGVILFPTLSHKDPKWGVWDVCKVMILFVWFAYMLMLIESAISAILPSMKMSNNLYSVLNATITDLLAFVFIIYFAVYLCRENLSSLGFSAKNLLRNISYGIMGYLATIPVLIVALLFIVWVSAAFNYKPPMQPVVEIFLVEKKMALITYLTIFVTIFGPIVEEVFFRGFMYPAVKKKWGFKVALLLTSGLFALLHANLAGFLPIMILGMLLCYLFERTGTLVASCTVHVLHNTAMVGMVFLIKGLFQ